MHMLGEGGSVRLAGQGDLESLLGNRAKMEGETDMIRNCSVLGNLDCVGKGTGTRSQD